MFATPAFNLPVTLRRVGWITMACASLFLSACGGGDRASEYEPASIVSFGDESSAFVSGSGDFAAIKGLTYSVNVLSNLTDTVTYCTDVTPDTLCATGTTQTGVTNFVASTTTSAYFTSVNQGDIFNTVTKIELGTGNYASTSGDLKRTTNQFYNCAASTIWTQYLARSFGKGYEDACQLDQPGAVTYATVNAKVADLAAQIAEAKSDGRLKAGVLVTLWLGQNDLIEIFDNDALSLSQKEAEAQARAATLIGGVKDILATGAKVVLVNAPNLAYSPYALDVKSESCAGVSDRPCNPDMDKLVVAFNKQLITSLGSEYALNGRQLGYVDAAQLTNAYARSTSYQNKRLCEGSGALDPLACHTQNLVEDGNTSAYLWADDQRLAWTLHRVIGETAFNRATEQF